MNNNNSQDRLLKLLLTREQQQEIKPRPIMTEFERDEITECLIKPLLNALITSAIPCFIIGFGIYPFVFVTRLFIILAKNNKA